MMGHVNLTLGCWHGSSPNIDVGQWRDTTTSMAWIFREWNQPATCNIHKTVFTYQLQLSSFASQIPMIWPLWLHGVVLPACVGEHLHKRMPIVIIRNFVGRQGSIFQAPLTKQGTFGSQINRGMFKKQPKELPHHWLISQSHQWCATVQVWWWQPLTRTLGLHRYRVTTICLMATRRFVYFMFSEF